MEGELSYALVDLPVKLWFLQKWSLLWSKPKWLGRKKWIYIPVPFPREEEWREMFPLNVVECLIGFHGSLCLLFSRKTPNWSTFFRYYLGSIRKEGIPQPNFLLNFRPLSESCSEMISGMYSFHHADDFFLFFFYQSVNNLVFEAWPEAPQLSTARHVGLRSPHNFSVIVVTIFLRVYFLFLDSLLLHTCDTAHFQESA